jgi:hypothetical protein
MDRFLLRSSDPQPDSLVLHVDDSHENVVSDQIFFAYLTGQDEH